MRSNPSARLEIFYSKTREKILFQRDGAVLKIKNAKLKMQKAFLLKAQIKLSRTALDRSA
jgi:hypothetical protein